jgi:hypothetical protein
MGDVEMLRANASKDKPRTLRISRRLEAHGAQRRTPVRLEVPGGARLEERALLGKRHSIIPYCPFRDCKN